MLNNFFMLFVFLFRFHGSLLFGIILNILKKFLRKKKLRVTFKKGGLSQTMVVRVDVNLIRVCILCVSICPVVCFEFVLSLCSTYLESLACVFYTIITPYIRILDSDWLTSSVFYTYFHDFGNFPLCRGICQNVFAFFTRDPSNFIMTS